MYAVKKAARREAWFHSYNDPESRVYNPFAKVSSEAVIRNTPHSKTGGVGTTPHPAEDSPTLAQRAQLPRLPLDLESLPMSEEKLTAEIKGIYAGLVMVETKCIDIDAAQAADPPAQLDSGQWQALIALHRTLLYEHHDFLVATQHPSATAAIRALPKNHSLPARMWKHGIHAFLEVLRRRRPDSQDYMLSFIYLAYQMMALLYQTVPVFLDTWIECLGDLTRCRMAVEEEKEPHAQWSGVAASWYIKASDRYPQVGRLYHHLATIERPSLRKFACYKKSLTRVVAFPNARESIATLCMPILEDAQPVRPTHLATEAKFCKMHADLFLSEPNTSRAMQTAQQPGPCQWREYGVLLALINKCSLLRTGDDTGAAFSRVEVNKGPRKLLETTFTAEQRYPNTKWWSKVKAIVARCFAKRAATVSQLVQFGILLRFTSNLGVAAQPLRGGSRRPQQDGEQLAEQMLSLPGPWALAVSGIALLFCPLPVSEDSLRELRLSVHIAAVLASGLWLIFLTTVPDETQVLAYSIALWFMIYPSHVRLCARAAKNANLRVPFAGTTALLTIVAAVVSLAFGGQAVVPYVTVAGPPVATGWTLSAYGILKIYEWRVKSRARSRAGRRPPV